MERIFSEEQAFQRNKNCDNTGDPDNRAARS